VLLQAFLRAFREEEVMGSDFGVKADERGVDRKAQFGECDL
jgi:hypothetical protein